MKLLFVCNTGMHRSKTAAEILAYEHETRAKGLYKNILDFEDLDWAELVLVMEEAQHHEINARYPEHGKQVVALDIPPSYSYGEPELRVLCWQRTHNALKESVIAIER